MSEASDFVAEIYARSFYPDGDVKELAEALENMDFARSLAIAEKLGELLGEDRLGKLVALVEKQIRSKETKPNYGNTKSD